MRFQPVNIVANKHRSLHDVIVQAHCAATAWSVQYSEQRHPQSLVLRCQTVQVPTLHGGPRLCCATVQAGVGRRGCPRNTAVTCRRPPLQHGHKCTSILATRAMNPWADSVAWGLGSGIYKASLAAFNLTRLKLEASTP